MQTQQMQTQQMQTQTQTQAQPQAQQMQQADSDQPMTRAHVDFKLVRLKERVLETALKGEAPPPELLAEVKKYQDALNTLVIEDTRQKQQEALERGMNPFRRGAVCAGCRASHALFATGEKASIALGSEGTERKKPN